MDLEKIIKSTPQKTISSLCEEFKTKDLDKIYVEMISKYLLSIEDVKKLWLHVKVYGTYLKLTETYLMMRKDRTFGNFFSSITYLYDLEPTLAELKGTLSLVKRVKDKVEVDIEDALIYLNTRIGERCAAPKPPWVNVKKGENRSMLTDIPERVLDDRRYLDLLDESTNLFFSFIPEDEEKVDFGDGEQLVKDKIPLDVRRTVQNYLSKNLPETGENSRVRVFGPQNRFMDKHCPYNLNALGPCRMLNCYCRGEDDTIVEWFTGYCGVCSKKILDKSWALRYPYPDGGWDGVYCSFECLESDQYFEGDENYDQYVRMENMKDSLLTIGIMDRTEV